MGRVFLWAIVSMQIAVLYFFQVAVIRTGKLPYSKCFSFLIIYQSNRKLQMRIISKLISNILNILAVKTEEVEKSF